MDYPNDYFSYYSSAVADVVGSDYYVVGFDYCVADFVVDFVGMSPVADSVDIEPAAVHTDSVVE